MPRKDLLFFWPDRIQEQNARNLKLSIQEQEKELRAIYKDSWDDIKAQLYEVMYKIERDAGEGGIMVNDLYRNNRYWELLNYIKENLSTLGEKELKIVEPELIAMYKQTQALIEKEIPGKPINPRFLNTAGISAEKVVRQSWCLDGKEFSDRIWDNKEKLLLKLNKSITDFMVQGKGTYQLALKLEADMKTGEYNAFRIVRTETAHMQNKASVDKYTEYGFKYGKFLGRDCCDMCKEKSGKVYALDQLERMIPQHPNCTCSFILIPQGGE